VKTSMPKVRPPTKPTSPIAASVGDLIDRYDISSAELEKLSRALKATVQTEGWVLIERLLEKFRTGIPMAALREPSTGHSREYYVGQVDFIESFVALVRATAAQADEADDDREKVGKTVRTMLRPGRGPLA
jgi:hypothetical protein